MQALYSGKHGAIMNLSLLRRYLHSFEHFFEVERLIFFFFYRRVILEKMGVNKMSLSEFFVLLKFSASSPWIFR